MGSSAPPPPPPPDYAAANREGIIADIETLPARREIDQASRLGTKGEVWLGEYVGSGASRRKKMVGYDFTGLGEADLQRAQLGVDRETAFARAQDLLDVQAEFGQQFLETSREQLRASDPIGFALREQLGQSVTNELSAGRSMTEGQRRAVEQSTRAAQAARGNIFGVAPAVEEAMATSGRSEQVFQQRQQNASAFLAGTTPLSQFGQLRQASAGAAPFATLATQGIAQNNNAGQAAAAFAQQTFGTQAQIYNTQMSNQSNPWMQGLGMAAGLGGQLGAAKLIGCWVAREVYGEENPKWKKFRKWVIQDAPENFRRFYIENGERIAESIKNRPDIKGMIRNWMDSKLEVANA